ncbi:hypothetical protein U1Q18_042618, partial [Sarracenia purpurea var. burkii]
DNNQLKGKQYGAWLRFKGVDYGKKWKKNTNGDTPVQFGVETNDGKSEEESEKARREQGKQLREECPFSDQESSFGKGANNGMIPRDGEKSQGQTGANLESTKLMETERYLRDYMEVSRMKGLAMKVHELGLKAQQIRREGLPHLEAHTNFGLGLNEI